MDASCACMGRIEENIWNAVKGSKHKPKNPQKVRRPSVLGQVWTCRRAFTVSSLTLAYKAVLDVSMIPPSCIWSDRKVGGRAHRCHLGILWLEVAEVILSVQPAM